jgi:hypothetical protein
VWEAKNCALTQDSSLLFCPATGCYGVIDTGAQLTEPQKERLAKLEEFYRKTDPDFVELSPVLWPEDIKLSMSSFWDGQLVKCPVCGIESYRSAYSPGYYFQGSLDAVSNVVEVLYRGLFDNAAIYRTTNKETLKYQVAAQYIRENRGKSFNRNTYEKLQRISREKDELVIYTAESLRQDVLSGKSVYDAILAFLKA